MLGGARMRSLLSRARERLVHSCSRGQCFASCSCAQQLLGGSEHDRAWPSAASRRPCPMHGSSRPGAKVCVPYQPVLQSCAGLMHSGRNEGPNRHAQIAVVWHTVTPRSSGSHFAAARAWMDMGPLHSVGPLRTRCCISSLGCLTPPHRMSFGALWRQSLSLGRTHWADACPAAASAGEGCGCCTLQAVTAYLLP